MKRLACGTMALALMAATTHAASIEAPGGLAVKVDEAGGRYEIAAGGVGWTFAGAVPGPLEDVKTQAIKDTLGAGQEISFRFWDSHQKPMRGSICIYTNRPIAMFTLTVPDAQTRTPDYFPSFTVLPAGLHPFSHRESVFSPPDFALSPRGMPWVMFDDSAKTWILSPASHFLAARMSGDGKVLAASGLNPTVRAVPAGFEQKTLLAVDKGINKTWETWGHALTDAQGKNRPANDADVGLKYFGYWTDNGASYYYNYDQNLGYAGTLLALAAHFKAARIPLGYMQLDSWWYYKSFQDPRGATGGPKSRTLPAGEWNRYGGLLDYKAHKDLFPDGLAAFQKKLGLPLITHNRWIDRASPYHEKYNISGVAAVDPKWWNDIAQYLKDSGVVTYEQDWLNEIYNNSPELGSTVDQGDAFMDNMARATRERGQTMQYCMELPCHYLQGSKYDNLTTVRVSEDGFARNRWMPFLFTSRLASSLGEWPWTDVFRSTDRESVLLADLSAGMVGVGDAIGKENRDNIMMAIRGDGVIVKPDAAITPTDATYIAIAGGKRDLVIGSTYSDHDLGRTAYVFAFSQGRAAGADIRFTPAALGVKGACLVWDAGEKKGTMLAEGAEFSGQLGAGGSSYYEVTPVSRSGIALLGDEGKFVSLGKQRVASLKEERGKLAAELVLVPGDQAVTLHGFAAAAPKVTASNGSAGDVAFDQATRHFSVKISPEGEPKKETRINVTLEAGTRGN